MENNMVSAEALKYLETRSEDLRNYSAKLRENVEEIVNRFGDNDYCSICHNYGTNSNHFKYETFHKTHAANANSWGHSNEIGEGWIEITGSQEEIERLNEFVKAHKDVFGRATPNDLVENMRISSFENPDGTFYSKNKYYDHDFKPKIELGLGFDLIDKLFLEEENVGYCLVIEDDHMKIRKFKYPSEYR